MFSWLSRVAPAALIVFGLAQVGWTQDVPAPTAAAIQGSRLITVSGVLTDAGGQPRTGSIGLSFSLYAGQAGGEALWQERQVVTLDARGQYSVLLGVTVPGGVPPDAFGEGKAQWLGVAVEGEAELPRVLLVAVPYALRAADADTLGGKPIASFVLSSDLEKVVEEKVAATTSPTTATGGVAVVPTTGTVSTVGTLGNELGSNTWYGEFAGAGGGGSWNSYFGQYAGNTNTAGSGNSSFGWASGRYNTGNDNSFFGAGAGLNNTASNNAFFGQNAGNQNATGTSNSYFGKGAGEHNTGGYHNSSFGHDAGHSSTWGNWNAFFGYRAGYANQSGWNSFYGANAGENNTEGYGNSFLGFWSGLNHTLGHDNTFLGSDTGNSSTVEVGNTLLGADSNFDPGSDPSTSPVTNATAIGYQAYVAKSNSLVLGSITGVNGASASTNVGIGTTAPTARLEVVGDVKVGSLTGVHGTAVSNALPVVIDASGKLGTADGSGSFGIGVTAPAYPLQVRRAGGAGSFAVSVDNVLGAGNRDVMLSAVPDQPTAPAGFVWYYNNASGAHAGLTLSDSGNVGIGTTTPSYPLQVRRAGGLGALAVSVDNVMGAGNRDVQWRAVPDGAADPAGFAWYYNNASGQHLGLTLNENGYLGIGATSAAYPLQLASGAYVSAGGVWTDASSRSLKQEIAALPADQALAALAQLTPVTYAYKASPGERHVGFIAEDVPALVATADRKSLSPMDIVATLTKVVQEQQATIAELKARNTEVTSLRAEATDLRARLAELEEQMRQLLTMKQQ